MLEDREQELQQLRLSVKERERDLEGLHQVLSNNKATIQVNWHKKDHNSASLYGMASSRSWDWHYNAVRFKVKHLLGFLG